MNDTLMQQCRREAYEKVVTPQMHHDIQYIEAMTEDYRAGYAAALYHERSKPRTGLTAEEAMEVVRGHHFRDQHPAESADTYLDEMYDDLRARLTAKLNTNTNG